MKIPAIAIGLSSCKLSSFLPGNEPWQHCLWGMVAGLLIVSCYYYAAEFVVIFLAIQLWEILDMLLTNIDKRRKEALCL